MNKQYTQSDIERQQSVIRDLVAKVRSAEKALEDDSLRDSARRTTEAALERYTDMLTTATEFYSQMSKQC